MPVGILRLIVPETERPSDFVSQQVYLTGFDGIPSPCRARCSGDELVVEREGADSVKLHIPWQVEGYGRPLVATGTLQQRDRAYFLPLELARGKLNQVRNQLADWQQLGLDTPEAVTSKIGSALRCFIAAACGQGDLATCAVDAQAALRHGFEAAELLAAAYCEQALTVRHLSTGKLPVAFGVSLGGQSPTPAAAAPLTALCNTVVSPMIWRDVVSIEDEYNWRPYQEQVDWARGQNLNVTAGPLLKLDDRGLPVWLALWHSDAAGILSFASEYVARVVQKFQGQVSFWNVASYSHRADSLGLRDEDKLRAVIRAVETVRRHDADTPVIVSFDQPWGEFLRRTPAGYAPFHVADHFVRTGLPLAALGLEVEVGYAPDGTFHRDVLEWSRLIDLWSVLNLPLYVFLTIPGGSTPDAVASCRSTPVADVWPGGWSPESQAAWVRQYVPMLLSKPSVQGIAWQQLHDGRPHDLPHGGLYDAGGHPKPALQALAALRREHLA